jgi:hypothetical protein
MFLKKNSKGFISNYYCNWFWHFSVTLNMGRNGSMDEWSRCVIAVMSNENFETDAIN